jgi:hypothetical protein
MRNSLQHDDQNSFRSTYGLLFFGVPSQGMNVEALAAMVENQPARYNLSLLDENVGFRLRNKHHQAFCEAFDFPDSKIVYFFEQKKTPTVQQVSRGPYVMCLTCTDAMF